MKSIGDIFRDKNIKLDTADPVLIGGFTQCPNFILRNPNLSAGAKVAYSLFLSYAWNDELCFPGQDRLAEDMGMSRPRVSQFVGELSKASLITIKRRGLGQTNIYIIHFRVKWKKKQKNKSPDVGGPTSGG